MPWEEDGEVSLEPEKLVFGYKSGPTNEHFQSNNVLHFYQYATTLEHPYPDGVTEDTGVTLTKGTNYFKTAQDDFLLGFDEGANEGDYIATYPADAVISVPRKDSRTLYAVWEPMVYLNIVNATEREHPRRYCLTAAQTPPHRYPQRSPLCGE